VPLLLFMTLFQRLGARARSEYLLRNSAAISAGFGPFRETRLRIQQGSFAKR